MIRDMKPRNRNRDPGRARGPQPLRGPSARTHVTAFRGLPPILESFGVACEPILKAAAVIAHQHHEKYDGSGYPQGLKGDDIHKYARIVAVADVFDALSHKRCYKEAWPIEQVVGHLREVAGHHLDPQYVELLIQNIDKAQEINRNWPD